METGSHLKSEKTHENVVGNYPSHTAFNIKYYIFFSVAGTFLKYLSLVLLTAQNAIFILSMRYVRTREGDLFFTTTAVILQESIKCLISLLIILAQVYHIDIKRYTILV